MIAWVSWVSRQTGQASPSANRLNNAALPSMTGMAAAGPMLPSPSTADPSVTTATVFRLIVSRRASAGFSAIARQTLGHTGRVRAGQVVPVFERHLRVDVALAPEMQQERPI